MSINLLSVESYLLKVVSIPSEVGQSMLSRYVRTNTPDLFPLPRSWEFGECYLILLSSDGSISKYLAWLVSKNELAKGAPGALPVSFALAVATVSRGPRVLVVESSGLFEVIVLRDDSATVNRARTLSSATQAVTGNSNLPAIGIEGFQPAGFELSTVPAAKVRFGFGSKRVVHINPEEERRALRIRRVSLASAVTAIVLAVAIIAGTSVSARLAQLDDELAAERRELDTIGGAAREEQDLLRHAARILQALAQQGANATYYGNVAAVAGFLTLGDLVDTISLQGNSMQFAGEFRDPVDMLARMKDSGKFRFIELLQSQPNDTGARFKASFRGELKS